MDVTQPHRDAARIARPFPVGPMSVTIPTREVSRAAQPQLTDRETELIGLIALGLQNKVIAHELRISPNTVRAHLGNIMRKHNLSNRTQVAMLMLRPCLHSVEGETGLPV